MDNSQQYAPGWPGVAATWTSSAKNGVGTAIDSASRVWFTISHGILNEIYYPRVDTACTRDLGLIVTDGQSFFSEEKRDAQHQEEHAAPGVPLYHLTNTCTANRYRIEKDVLADPQRDAVVQSTRFHPLDGKLADYHLYVLLAPHLGNHGANNTAWVGDWNGVTMLFAQREGYALALACSTPFARCSVGFVGASDGWQDLSRHKEMQWTYTRAENGNVALTAEIDLQATQGEFRLALGFGSTPDEAAQRARASLLDNFSDLRDQYIQAWQSWQQTLLALDEGFSKGDIYRTSTAVLRTHESKTFPGGFIASLSIPWGFAQGDGDLGGYHLVWVRDLVETAGGLLAAGAKGDMNRVLQFLRVTQHPAGNWPQNMWIDGTAYWHGEQLDETALPLLMLEIAYREEALHPDSRRELWPMVRAAAAFIVRNGPITQQGRWEENAGYTPFTLAAAIAALLVAAQIGAECGEQDVARYLLETADAWNSSIEQWVYVENSAIAQQVGVGGYYVRLVPPHSQASGDPFAATVRVKNRPSGQNALPAADLVSTDALALVRFGLRAADDPRIANTIKVIDAMLKIDTPFGPTWHRYNDDGYGEQQDGSPFDGVGIGRGWPLLTGERAHYELAAGRRDAAASLLHTMEQLASDGGLISEQVWDAADIPDKDLFCGRPSGSARPLVWAHAEYIKLRRSLHDGKVFDMPRQAAQRYLVEKIGSEFAIWRFNTQSGRMAAGKKLRVEVLSPATVHWSSDNWQTTHDTVAADSKLGTYVADIDSSHLAPDSKIDFTFHWTATDRWEGSDYSIVINH